jgi:F-type H+-transporting ATPase subunit b
MEDTLHALGGLLLRSVPTFVLVILLNFYLKAVFFKPMEKVLRQRYEATEGARKAAEQSLERAAAKTAEYEAAMRAARDQAQDQLHKQLQDRESAGIASARQRTDLAVREARAQLARDVEQAKAVLGRDSDALADQIAESILRRSAA